MLKYKEYRDIDECPALTAKDMGETPHFSHLEDVTYLRTGACKVVGSDSIKTTCPTDDDTVILEISYGKTDCSATTPEKVTLKTDVKCNEVSFKLSNGNTKKIVYEAYPVPDQCFSKYEEFTSLAECNKATSTAISDTSK
jgi:hypothetical protein